MINKDAAINMLTFYHERLISDSKLKIRIGNYEYIFNADAVNYVGTGEEFLTVSLTDNGWTQYGEELFDGASWLESDNITLGGQDFQIVGKVFESSTDMIQRRKIFELYTSDELNMSLYSSGAGKNLDLFVNCGGTLDNYAEPAILETEYSFKLVWRQETTRLILYVNGEDIYSNQLAGFSEPKTFSKMRLGAGIYHENSFWRGTISEFKIYNGFAEI